MLDCEQTSDVPDGQATSGVKSQTETNWRSGFDSDQDGRRGKPKEEAQVVKAVNMAISTPEQRRLQIHGLMLAAKRIQQEERKREDKNFDTVLKYFRGKAETRKGPGQ